MQHQAQHMPSLSPETTDFIAELDAAVEAQWNLTRRILRCAVMNVSPGENVLAPMAYTLCRFGRWLESARDHFEKIDAYKLQRIEETHQAMHDAVRLICTDLLVERPGDMVQMKEFEDTQRELITLMAEFKTEFLANAMRHDPLTGLLLRYGIENEFLQIQKNARRNNTLLYIVLIDADRFKSINDSYGHQVGDIALRHLADTLKNIARPNEPLYRYGGEEFLLMMQCHRQQEATAAAERFLNAVRNAPLEMTANTSLKLTITAGLACVGNEESMDSAIERADRALYVGKATGRDRYVFAND